LWEKKIRKINKLQDYLLGLTAGDKPPEHEGRGRWRCKGKEAREDFELLVKPKAEENREGREGESDQDHNEFHCNRQLNDPNIYIYIYNLTI
jgi:hypothetical protein